MNIRLSNVQQTTNPLVSLPLSGSPNCTFQLRSLFLHQDIAEAVLLDQAFRPLGLIKQV